MFKERALKLTPGDWSTQRDLLIDLSTAVDELTVTVSALAKHPPRTGDGGGSDEDQADPNLNS